MLHFEQTIDCPAVYFDLFGVPAGRVLFFDIETTGFSPESSYVYLIGCAYVDENIVKLRQWFLNDISEEKSLVKEFGDFVKNFQILVHYNGTTFDLPYLQKKARRHRLDNLYFRVEGDDADEKNEDLTQSYDVYRHLLPFKKILGLKDLKQKTVEQFLGVFRKDILTGKDLIPLYTEFIGRYRYECIRNKNQIFDGGTNFLADSEDQTEKIPDFSGTGLKKMPDSPASAMLFTLLLHNGEDILGLIKICRLLPLKGLLDGDFSVAESISPLLPPCKTLRIDTKLDPDLLNLCFFKEITKPLPAGIPAADAEQTPHCLPAVSLAAALTPGSLLLHIPVISGTLKYVFENYKDYYYLPVEDCAMHKSIAQFVGKEYRKKATQETCYQKKEGDFLPQPEEIISPAFRRYAKDRFSFFENTKEALLNPSVQKSFAAALLKWLFC